ncbi:MAG: SagB/ThcOx family dehydrogenase [Methanobacteriota archaeon]
MKPTGRIFMEQTRYEHLTPSDQINGLPAPPLEKPEIVSGPCIFLTPGDMIDVPPVNLRDAIETRRSIRRYTQEPLTIEDLSYLLWSTQGITHIQDPYYTLRTVPSAGGRHAFETYLCINRVTGVEPGIYRYLAFSHQLILVDNTPGFGERTMKVCLDQTFIKTAAVVFLWFCVIYRMAWRYSERAYRLVHLDAGHVCQNLYLSAGQIGCGICAIAAFDDQIAADLLNIDGEEEFVIYCATVGKIPD